MILRIKSLAIALGLCITPLLQVACGNKQEVKPQQNVSSKDSDASGQGAQYLAQMNEKVRLKNLSCIVGIELDGGTSAQGAKPIVDTLFKFLLTVKDSSDFGRCLESAKEVFQGATLEGIELSRTIVVSYSTKGKDPVIQLPDETASPLDVARSIECVLSAEFDVIFTQGPNQAGGLMQSSAKQDLTRILITMKPNKDLKTCLAEVKKVFQNAVSVESKINNIITVDLGKDGKVGPIKMNFPENSPLEKAPSPQDRALAIPCVQSAVFGLKDPAPKGQAVGSAIVPRYLHITAKAKQDLKACAAEVAKIFPIATIRTVDTVIIVDLGENVDLGPPTPSLEETQALAHIKTAQAIACVQKAELDVSVTIGGTAPLNPFSIILISVKAKQDFKACLAEVKKAFPSATVEGRLDTVIAVDFSAKK